MLVRRGISHHKTHGLSDTMIQPGHKTVLGVAGSTVIDNIHRDTMLSGGTTDVEKSSTVGLGEYIDEDSIVFLSSGSYEVALQHNRGVDSHESQHLVGQLKVIEDMIVVAMRHLDDTHALVT